MVSAADTRKMIHADNRSRIKFRLKGHQMGQGNDSTGHDHRQIYLSHGDRQNISYYQAG